MTRNYVVGLLSGVVLASIVAIAPANAQGNAMMAKPKDEKMMKMPQKGMMDKKMGEVLVTTGMFKRVTHNVKGTATIYEFPDGTREVRLKGFSTEKGPALHVFLVAAGDAKDNMAVTKAGHIDLGPLKKQMGDITLKVPKGIDLWKYRAVTIWCDKFKVNFGTAPLAAKQ